MASIAERINAAVKALRATPSALDALSTFGGRYFSYPVSNYVDGAYVEMQSASYAYIYASQENVRIVVDAIGRVAAKRSLKCYSRLESGEKEEEAEFIAAQTMRTPNDFQDQKELLNYMVKDKLIYDDAYLWDFGPDIGGRRFLLRVPPHAMGVKSDNRLHPTGYRVVFQDGSHLDLSTDEVVHWRGYSADSNRIGVSPLETLRTMLLESTARKARMTETIKGGLIKGGIVTRPIEAPEWSPKARERFQDSFGARLLNAAKGGVALLEDGMEFVDAGITPKEAELLDSRKFDLAIVSNLFGINPALFSTDGNLAMAREMLEEDLVDPLLGGLASALTHQLIRGTYSDDEHFFRFSRPPLTDVGTLFEAGSKATGQSTLTPNEFREDFLDKPPIPSGDTLVTNPGAGSGGLPPKPGSGPRGRQPRQPEDVVDPAKEIEQLLFKGVEARKADATRHRAAAERRQAYVAAHEALLRKHFLRQKRQQENGQYPHLNQERWDRELATDLLALAQDIVREEGNITSASLGAAFDMSKVKNYLTVGAENLAANINASSYDAVADIISIEGIKAAESIYEKASVERASALAEARATQLAAWSVLEAGRQLEE